MAHNTGRAKRSEKGLLTPDNCVVTLIDLQPQMLFGVANFDRQAIINNNVALSKAARVFEVPVRAQHGRDSELQREYMAADPGHLSEPGPHRTLFHELLG
jgi:nicotinamidase-related amidase